METEARKVVEVVVVLLSLVDVRVFGSFIAGLKHGRSDRGMRLKGCPS